MIDLNDISQLPERLNLDEVRERLAATAPDWLPSLFPQARMAPDRRSLRCADLSGRPPRKEGSCVIHLKGSRAGWGFDYGTGESAGPIDLVSYATGLCGIQLFEEAARIARMDQSAPSQNGAVNGYANGHVNGYAAKVDHSAEVRRILAGCQPVAGSIAERYLTARGIAHPGSPDLQFHPDLTDYGSRRGWPGLVAIVRDARGEPTGGIHRTFLTDDGSAKAPIEKPKTMLGPIGGGSVRLYPMSADGRLGAGEGIETCTSAYKIFGVPTWATLSAGNLADWQWPEGTTHVTIFADAGNAGQEAARKLAERLALAGIPQELVSPLHGDDFNDDLRHGVTAESYRPVEPPAPTKLETLEQFDAAARALAQPADMKQLIGILGQLATANLDSLSERQVLAILKTATGIAAADLKKQLDELRRRPCFLP